MQQETEEIPTVTIPGLPCCAHGLDLVLRGVPVHLQVFSFTLLVEDIVHGMHDLFVGSPLEGNHLAQVVES